MPSPVNGLDAPPSGVTLKIGEVTYEPRWSFHAEYLLGLRNLTLKDILEGSSGRRSAVLAVEMLAAMIAYQYPEGAAPNPNALAKAVLPGQNAEIWPALIRAGRAAGAIVDKPKNEEAPMLVSDPAPTPQLQ